jgi:head-tail adaptor
MKNLAVNPADRRHWVQIQSEGTAQDVVGGQTSTGWATIRATWASISTVGSKNAFQAGQFSAQVTHIINIRAIVGDTEITPGMRVVFGIHVYPILDVDNVELRNISINLICLEINGGQ